MTRETRNERKRARQTPRTLEHNTCTNTTQFPHNHTVKAKQRLTQEQHGCETEGGRTHAHLSPSSSPLLRSGGTCTPSPPHTPAPSSGGNTILHSKLAGVPPRVITARGEVDGRGERKVGWGAVHVGVCDIFIHFLLTTPIHRTVVKRDDHTPSRLVWRQTPFLSTTETSL